MAGRRQSKGGAIGDCGTSLEGLRRERLRAGLTQAQLGERAGVTQHTVSDAETGRRTPRAGTIAAFAAALGVPVWRLFEADEEEPLPELAAKLIEALEIEETRIGTGDALADIMIAYQGHEAALDGVCALALEFSRLRKAPDGAPAKYVEDLDAALWRLARIAERHRQHKERLGSAWGVEEGEHLPLEHEPIANPKVRELAAQVRQRAA
jgi:transcriptional regulator with XRE-family HTH domain